VQAEAGLGPPLPYRPEGVSKSRGASGSALFVAAGVGLL